MHPALLDCLRAPTTRPALPSQADWQAAWRACLSTAGTPIGLALRGGFAADRLAWAFAAGYQAALRRLLPGAAPQELLALCLTEASGQRPRDLRCSATRQADGRWLLAGDKSWVAFGGACTTLLVIARDGLPPGAVPEPSAGDAAAAASPRLLALRVPHAAPGVSISDKPAAGPMPELVQGRLVMQAVLLPADACLAGDGYIDFARPFAALEDLYMGAAVLAYLLREARARGWPPALRERIVAALVLMAALADAAPDDPAMLVALAGALDGARQIHAEAALQWAATPDEPAAGRWLRDARFFGAPRESRSRRAASAWLRLGAGETERQPAGGSSELMPHGPALAACEQPKLP